MEGMQILNQTPITEAGTLSWVLIISGMLLAILTFFGYYKYNKGREKDKGLWIIVFLYLICVIIMFTGGRQKVETERYSYECTFDDTVTANDIIEHFDVISSKNGVWKVEDKEN